MGEALRHDLNFCGCQPSLCLFSKDAVGRIEAVEVWSSTLRTIEDTALKKVCVCGVCVCVLCVCVWSEVRLNSHLS